MAFKPPAAALLFDLDGTLIDSRADLAAAANYMRTTFRLPELPVAAITAMIGDGLPALVTRALEGRIESDDIELDDAITRYRRYYHEHCTDETVVYAGLEAALQALHDVPKVVVTNKPEAFARQIVAALGLAPHFRGIVGGDSCDTVKPAPEMLHYARELAGVAEADTAQCVMIGDNWTDITGGRAAGMPTCAVEWGFGDPVKLYDAEPHFVAETPDDLPAMFG
jgi:phosphoglycolate phosphatase